MNDVNISLSNDVIKGIIQKKLESSIAAALCTETNLLEAIVRNSLNIKVDRNGGKADYYTNDRDKMDLIEWMCQEAIKSETKNQIQLWVQSSKPKIEAEIRKQMSGQIKNIAASAAASLAEGAKNGWIIKCDIKAEQSR